MSGTVGRRVRLGLFSGLLAATATLSSVTPASAASQGATEIKAVGGVSLAAVGYGGDVQRSIVMGRARDWYDRNVAYNQADTEWDENHGRQYRTDCSGYVSMVWKLTTSLTTYTLDSVSHEIHWNDLLEGDALLFKGNASAGTGHVMVFEKWVNADTKADFWVYEEANTTDDMNHRKINVIDARHGGFLPYRYDHIVKG